MKPFGTLRYIIIIMIVLMVIGLIVNEIKINKVFIGLFFFLKGFSTYFQLKNEINKIYNLRRNSYADI